MNIIETNLKDCYILEPNKFGDERGYFSPFFVIDEIKKNNLKFAEVVQCSRSMSNKGILRGLHFQKGEYAQAKIVECLQGAVLDVAVDIREGSPTYGMWTSVLLTPENNRQLLIPRGFAHGFVSLEDNTLFQYLVDNTYMPQEEGGIAWDDPEINIDWQLEKYSIEKPILSEKDTNRDTLKNNTFFKMED